MIDWLKAKYKHLVATDIDFKTIHHWLFVDKEWSIAKLFVMTLILMSVQLIVITAIDFVGYRDIYERKFRSAIESCTARNSSVFKFISCGRWCLEVKCQDGITLIID